MDIIKNSDMLFEDALVFGKKMYPPSNNVVIMAGSSGSGKGFIIDNLLAIEGKRLDPDKIKELALKNQKIIDYIKRETGEDISNFNLKNPDDTSRMHDLIDKLNIEKRLKQNLFASFTSNNKPNLIIDTTLAKPAKFFNLSRQMMDLGYPKENIHLVWVVTSLELSLQQNAERDRVVNPDIVTTIYSAVAANLKNILSPNALRKYMDGDIYVVLNRKKIDTLLQQSGFGGAHVKKSTYFKIKDKGHPLDTDKEMFATMKLKVKEILGKDARF